MTLRKHFLPLLFSILLLGAQHMGWVHALSHLEGAGSASVQGQPGKNRAQLPADKVCEQCLAFAQIAAALDRAPFAFIADSLQLCNAPASLAQDAPAAAFTAFLSRAPPVLL